jgi:hypothetical protein
MGDVVSLSTRRRRRDGEARMAEMTERGFMGPVDVSDLTTDVDRILAELSRYTGIAVERVAPLVRTVEGAGGNNVVTLRPSASPRDDREG